MTYADDPEAYRERLQAKLQPERIRATLAFSGPYQLTHQMIQNAVLDQVQGFFGRSPLDDTWWHGREDYEREVRYLHKNPFKASLLWLQKMRAISAEQRDRWTTSTYIAMTWHMRCNCSRVDGRWVMFR